MRIARKAVLIGAMVVWAGVASPVASTAPRPPEQPLEEFLKLLDRPVAVARAAPTSKTPKRVVLWEHILKMSDFSRGVWATTSLAVLTCGEEDDPTRLHKPLWATFGFKSDTYLHIESCTWDVVYHPESKRIYIAQLITRPVRESYTLNLYAVDLDATIDPKKLVYDPGKKLDEQAIGVAKPLGTFEARPPKPVGDRESRDSVTNPKIVPRKDAIVVFVSRPDQSVSVVITYDLKTGTWAEGVK